MKFREIGKTGIEASVLGLGCMRLPMNGDAVDESRAIEMIRYAIDNGVNYIDTAYPYHDQTSEIVVGKALADGYREKVNLITKLPSWLITSEDDVMKYLDEQLDKLGTDHLDIYLLHAMNRSRWEVLKEHGIIDKITEMKASGKVKHIGFSFHDDLAFFKEMVDAYPWEVAMIQFNYMDQNIQAGVEGLKYAESKGLPLIVMEPLKGGMLATPSEDIKALWKQVHPERSPIEWALKYVANFENVKVVLSGMSNMEQLKENIEIADRLIANDLSEAELALIEKVRQSYDSKVLVPCTKCGYCIPCPQGVEIPKNFDALNQASIFNQKDKFTKTYEAFADEAKAANCVACGACEPQCPQKIQIIDALTKVVDYFEA